MNRFNSQNFTAKAVLLSQPYNIDDKELMPPPPKLPTQKKKNGGGHCEKNGQFNDFKIHNDKSTK